MNNTAEMAEGVVKKELERARAALAKGELSNISSEQLDSYIKKYVAKTKNQIGRSRWS